MDKEHKGMPKIKEFKPDKNDPIRCVVIASDWDSRCPSHSRCSNKARYKVNDEYHICGTHKRLLERDGTLRMVNLSRPKKATALGGIAYHQLWAEWSDLKKKIKVAMKEKWQQEDDAKKARDTNLAITRLAAHYGLTRDEVKNRLAK